MRHVGPSPPQQQAATRGTAAQRAQATPGPAPRPLLIALVLMVFAATLLGIGPGVAITTGVPSGGSARVRPRPMASGRGATRNDVEASSSGSGDDSSDASAAVKPPPKTAAAAVRAHGASPKRAGKAEPWYRRLADLTPPIADAERCADEAEAGRHSFGQWVPGWLIVERVLNTPELTSADSFTSASKLRWLDDSGAKGGSLQLPPPQPKEPMCKTSASSMPDVRGVPKLSHTHKKPRPKEHTPSDILLRLLFDNVDAAETFIAAANVTLVPDAAGEHVCAASTRRHLLAAANDDADDKAHEGDQVASNGVAKTDPPLAETGKAALHHQLGLRHNALDGAVPIDTVLVAGGRDHPSRAMTYYPPPVSFANDPAVLKADAASSMGHGAASGGGGAAKKIKFRIDKKFGDWHTFFQGSVDGLPLDGFGAKTRPKPGPLRLLHGAYPQVAKPGPPAFYSVFRNGAVVTDGNVITCARGYSTGACMWEFKVYGGLSTGASVPKAHRFAKIVAVCDFWCKGYFHFTHEHLPRLALVHHLILADPRIKVTVPVGTGYVGQYLMDVMGYRRDQLISSSGTYYATEEALYPQPQRCGSIFTQTLMMLRRIVFTRLGGLPATVCDAGSPATTAAADKAWGGEASAGKLRLLWAERQKLSRMPKNYYAIRKALEERFADRVAFRDTDELGVVEQIKAFNSADVVIGPHGANIANAMWMRHGSYLVEFISYPYANMCYFGTAARLAVRFGALFHGALKHGLYNSSVAEVGRHIEYALETRPRCGGGGVASVAAAGPADVDGSDAA